MKVLITAGGTTEKIDAVRSISNMSTGKLGSLTADCFATNEEVDKIFYICSESSVKPKSDKAKIIKIDDVSELESAVKVLLNHEKIDIIIHAMAVSDYRVKSVLSADNFTEIKVSKTEKISSDMEEFFILMKKTPKIISFFKNLVPNATLVGFKLLNDVSVDELIDAGYEILTKNHCDFVLANDLKCANNNSHIGYLIDKDKNYQKYLSKNDIAVAIVEATMGERDDKR